MNNDAKLSRRRFAQVAGLTSAVGPTIVSARALGRQDQPPASERLALGFIGMGTMNRHHLNAFWKRPEVQVLAVCDCDTKRRDHARKTVDEHYDKQTSKGGSAQHCRGFNDFRELLQRSDLDAVVIATPDHWHAIQIIEACKAGNLAYWHRQALLWDPNAWELGNEPEVGVATEPTVTVPMPEQPASKPVTLDRERRDPWKLPAI
jgi:hypothetical protein